MSREVRRVPLDFEWPINEIWSGFLMPDIFDGITCTACDGSGDSPDGKRLHALWYGYIPFKPEDNGSTPFTIDTPGVRAFAERNVASAPHFYGDGEFAIQREAQRLADLFNGQWAHHLNEADVAALVEAGRLRPTPTPEQVNAWALTGFGHDAINSWAVIKARALREGVETACSTCGGHGSTEAYPGQRAEAEAWTPTDPPTGEGWQVWEDVTEGSPITPVFPTSEALVEHLMSPDQRVTLREGPMSREEAESFVTAGWVPSFMASAVTGVVEGPVMPSVMRTVDQIEAL